MSHSPLVHELAVMLSACSRQRACTRTHAEASTSASSAAPQGACLLLAAEPLTVRGQIIRLVSCTSQDGMCI